MKTGFLPLGAEDAAWLHMEDAENPMVVNVLLELAATLDADVIRGLMERVTVDPRFRSVVVEPKLHIGRPHWEPHAGFDVDRHIEHILLADASEATLRTFIGHAVSSSLPLDRPLFRLLVIEREGRGTTLLFRVHHAIADGFGLLGLLLSSALAEGKVDVPQAPQRRGQGTEHGYLSSLARLVTLPHDPQTALKAPLGLEKRVGWSGPMSLATLRRIGQRASGTINDVVIALLAGALRRHLDRREVNLEGLEVRAMVPVSLRTPEDALDLGNRFGLMVLPLPIGIVDPIARISAVRDRTRDLKGSREAVVSRVVLELLGGAPRVVEDAGVAFFAKKTSLVLTNVPGPRRKFDIAGVPVTRVIFWVPQSGKMGLGLSVFSYAGAVTVGVLADVHAMAHPTLFVKDLEDEVDSLEKELAADAGAPSDVLASAQAAEAAITKKGLTR